MLKIRENARGQQSMAGKEDYGPTEVSFEWTRKHGTGVPAREEERKYGKRDCDWCDRHSVNWVCGSQCGLYRDQFEDPDYK